jgi:xylulokinase
VAAGAGDCAAAALGVGVERPGPVSLVLGTSGVVFAALPAYQPDREARVHVFCHAVPGAWHAMGVMLSAAGSLQWARDTFAPGVPFDALMAEADAVPAGAGGIVFLPYLSGERTPHADPDARGALVGLSASHTRGHVMRAVLEGVAFGLADSFDLLRELGVDATVARASGGGARSDFWLRICASVLGVPVCRMAVDEGSAFGAAMLGGIAGGMFAGVDEAVEACVRVRDTIDPEPAWLDVYGEQRERFRALYPALRQVLG